MAATEAPELRCLPPVIDERARILILGSFPSSASLSAGQYYAHGRNLFWRVLGEVLNISLSELPYPPRLAEVKAAGIAIWDVYASCTREGSLDSAIRNGIPQDFSRLLQLAPRLEKVCFNGTAAGRFSPSLAALGYQVVLLPSTSPAHASRSFAEKLAEWREGLSYP
jgi:hypoxanthine-DNA glycosylase